MKRFLFLLGVVLSPVAAVSAVDDEINKENALRGAWVVVSAELDGNVSKASTGDKFVFAGNKMTIIKPDVKESTVTFKLDPSKKPKQLDTDGLGIYELKGDDLTICISVSGNRPTAFDSKEGLLLKLKREKS